MLKLDLMDVTLVVLYIKRPVLRHLVELKSKEILSGKNFLLAFKIIPPGPGS